MKSDFAKVWAVACILVFSVNNSYSQLYEWRGPGRTGIYNETGLMKKWPAGGPSLLWESEGMGDGYSSPTVTDDAVYVTGRKDDNDVLTALTPEGKKKWEVVYGKAWTANHTGSRCTPTFYNGNIFLVSGSGDIVCVGSDGKIKWSKNHYNLYGSKPLMFGISESPIVSGNMVIVSPSGSKASMAAFNINDGKVVWEAQPLGQEPQYINPKIIDYAGKKMIINVFGKDIVAVDASNGKILWKVDYEAANSVAGGRKNHAITPVYKDGHILIANGYGWVALKLKLSADGSSAEKVWENRNFDPQLGGIVLLGDHLYASNHQAQPAGSWICVDWNSGKTLWTAKWNAQGSVISADGMLYLFEEKAGNVALVRPDPSKLDIVSEFRISKGSGPFWAHPVIKNGRLYIRHGEALMVYNIKA
ncbi:MAG TPA: PQQ-binding-like beta-propeller repeat protein [Bacteroidales bacterium]|nr:PQQ-binding-like beta-propeller repeat protein [Bacteroidales bacterium]